MSGNLEDERREYRFADLDLDSLHDDPIDQFDHWMTAALKREIADPTAMTVSTVSAEGKPWSRVVLLKGFDAEGFRFFTNYDSQKAAEIDANPEVALLFPWLQMDRQIIVGGRAEKLGAEEAGAYFASRPRESQLAAWASKQSHEIPSRRFLDEAFEKLSRQYDGADIPKPDYWGGYLVRPETFEFWQGGEHRLHDRFRYTLQTDGNWRIVRLSP